MFMDRCKLQTEKLFSPEKSLTQRQFLEDFRKASYDSMKPVARILGCLGCCLFPSKSKTVVINANDFIGERKCALKPDYTYDNNELKLVICKPKGSCCGLCPKRALPVLVGAAPVGMDGNHDVWLWQGRAWASALKAVVVYVCFRPAPEFEDPARMMDIVAAVKWTAARGHEFGADTSRLGLLASSAGGFVTTISALELGARDESALVKAVFLEVPGIFPDDMLGPYDGMCGFQQFIYSRMVKGQYVWFAGGEDNKADW
eukprot:UN0449